MTISWKAVGATNVGRRRRGNEDAYVADPGRGIFLVAAAIVFFAIGASGQPAREMAELVATLAPTPAGAP